MRAFIGLGGNLGEPAVAFRAAVAELGVIGQVIRVSSPLRQRAARSVRPARLPECRARAGDRSGAAPTCSPSSSAWSWRSAGTRRARRWGPRLIDLDILCLDGQCVEDPELDLDRPAPALGGAPLRARAACELDPGLLPWRNCSDLRVDVTVADLLPMVADQEVLRVGGPDWADPQVPQLGLVDG